MIDTTIHQLVQFGIDNNLLKEADRIYATNQVLGVLHMDAIEAAPEVLESVDNATSLLEILLDEAVNKGLLEDTITERDLFDTLLMNCLMPRPSEVIDQYNQQYQISPKHASDYFYKLSIASNYIRKTRTDQNIIWKSKTRYGDLDISINLSKPEKDPKDIAKAKLLKPSGYPKCLLCKENEGYFGTMSHPARQTHRIIPMEFSGEHWFLQYSPYTYYNEHCIVFNDQHIPMKIHHKTFANLLGFLDVLPHYFVGSNADLPIVGGSILTHDHYQGGHYEFAMAQAPTMKTYTLSDYPNIEVERVLWPMSVLRLRSEDKDTLLACASHILDVWKEYDAPEHDILSHSGDTPHNTITPIARMRKSAYELDLVLRNNRTNDQYPMGIFHPHEKVHNIKKENIGLIEVMGLAVLPARLKDEIALLKEELIKGSDDVLNIECLVKHNDWYQHLKKTYTNPTPLEWDTIIDQEIGDIFATVLEHCGVFKLDEAGNEGFDKFIQVL